VSGRRAQSLGVFRDSMPVLGNLASERQAVGLRLGVRIAFWSVLFSPHFQYASILSMVALTQQLAVTYGMHGDQFFGDECGLLCRVILPSDA
jgi:hypothetical protein